MKYQRYNLGYVEKGSIIEIRGKHSDARVFLVDDNNYENFKRGFNYNYSGGEMIISPFLLQIEKSADWNLIIMPHNHLMSSEKEYKILHEMRRTSLQPISDLIKKNNQLDHKKEHIFISYSENDFDETIQSLIDILKEKGMEINFERIEECFSFEDIGNKFSEARLSILILSKNYLKSHGNSIIENVISNEYEKESVILPIWHKISKNEMFELKDLLEKNIHRNTFSYDMEDIASEVVEITH